MSNSNYDNHQNRENFKGRINNDRSNYIGRTGGNRDNSGFRIRLSDNEMKAVRSIQEAFQLKSTVAVLGFSVRTLSEMIKDESLIDSITKYAKNNKNSTQINKSAFSTNKNKSAEPDPFARPSKKSPIEDIKPDKAEKDDK